MEHCRYSLTKNIQEPSRGNLFIILVCYRAHHFGYVHSEQRYCSCVSCKEEMTETTQQSENLWTISAPAPDMLHNVLSPTFYPPQVTDSCIPPCLGIKSTFDLLFFLNMNY